MIRNIRKKRVSGLMKKQIKGAHLIMWRHIVQPHVILVDLAQTQRLHFFLKAREQIVRR